MCVCVLGRGGGGVGGGIAPFVSVSMNPPLVSLKGFITHVTMLIFINTCEAGSS